MESHWPEGWKASKGMRPEGQRQKHGHELGQQTDRYRLANSTQKSILGTRCDKISNDDLLGLD
jgi:hypothetical protein